jgi:hypothetical protein
MFAPSHGLRYMDSMAIAADSQVRLYERVLENGRSAGPYVWRIRYALAHKGLSFESMPIGFAEIHKKVFGGRFKTVPVICHGDTMLAESLRLNRHRSGAVCAGDRNPIGACVPQTTAGRSRGRA